MWESVRIRQDVKYLEIACWYAISKHLSLERPLHINIRDLCKQRCWERAENVRVKENDYDVKWENAVETGSREEEASRSFFGE